MENNAKNTKRASDRRKPSSLRKALLIIILILGAAILAAIVFMGLLYGRMARPGTYVFAPEEGAAPSPTLTPSMAVSPAPASAAPAISLSPAPTVSGALPEEGDDAEELLDPSLEFEALPLSDLYTQTQLNRVQLSIMDTQTANKRDFVNILLVGVDRRGTRGDSNADTIMIATLDKKHGRLKLTSVLRDSHVPIPGVGDNRINSSAAHGGIPKLMETLNGVLHLDLQEYVLVDFRMFEKIVDAMDGIALPMTEKEISAANDVIAGLNKQRGVEYLWDGFIFANPGSVLLTGQQALAYARVRKIDSDFSRTNRQFKVLNAIYAKFRSKNLAQQTALLYDLLPLVETNISPTKIADIGLSALSMDVAGLLHERVPFDDTYRSGSVNRKSAIVMDMPLNAWKVHNFIYIFADEPEEAKLYTGGPSLPPRTPAPTPPPLLPPEGWPEGVPYYPPATDPAQVDPALPVYSHATLKQSEIASSKEWKSGRIFLNLALSQAQKFSMGFKSGE